MNGLGGDDAPVTMMLGPFGDPRTTVADTQCVTNSFLGTLLYMYHGWDS